ncbi:PBSX family phage terminase large subunit [Coralloluteibacterium thermophilus]|uniref:PBSX family phage terminase large subunit n=1 Tax=Coralloluteibacterium thermophilum TaxID=2707049 RepID=A0ABV9NHW5_9GAMM
MSLAPQVPIRIPVTLLPILRPRRFKILHGGRGGGKSHSVAQVLLAMACQRKLRILCAREIQKSIDKSSKQVLEDYIARLGLSPYFDIQKTVIVCRLTGSEFSFTGLREHTADSIKSYEGVDIVWVEEAASVSERSWVALINTIRKPGSEIWATFNPDDEQDYVYARFVKSTDPDALVIQINWRDNPWFPAELDTERRKLKAINLDLYNHVYEGHCRSVAGLLFKRHWFQFYDVLPARLNPYMATDWAGGPDPDDPNADPDFTEHGVWGLSETGDLYATDWWSGQEDPAEWIDAYIELGARHRPLAAFEEKGVILRSLNSSINKRMRETKTYLRRVALPSAGSKYERALGFAARAAAGTVWLPSGKPWALRLLNQLCAFNGQDGRKDDAVDVCSLIGRGLDEMRNAPPPPVDSRRPLVEIGTAEWLEAEARASQLATARNQRRYL